MENEYETNQTDIEEEKDQFLLSLFSSIENGITKLIQLILITIKTF